LQCSWHLYMLYTTVSFSWQLWRKGGGREREMFSVEGVIQKRWKCMQKIEEPWSLFTRCMCPIGHFVSYSPTAVFWFLSEYCPPWNCNGWHWSVWQGHCRTLWSVNESPEDSSHSELLGFWTCPLSSILEIENTAFWKLDLFPSSGEGKHLLCWVPQKELTSITGPDDGQNAKTQ
jgi:hypothetical protein